MARRTQARRKTLRRLGATNKMVQFITVATQKNKYLDILQQSAHRNNINLEILGLDQPWQGFSWRLLLIQRYLADLMEQRLNTEQMICVIDAYDVVILQSEGNIEQTIERIINKQDPNSSIRDFDKIIVGMDYNQNLSYQWCGTRLFGVCNNFRLNAGSFCGKANVIYDYIELIKKHYDIENNLKADDQVIMTKICQRYPELFVVDQQRELFLIIATGPDKEIDLEQNGITFSDNTLYRNEIDTPSILHGPYKTDLMNMYVALGYVDESEYQEQPSWKIQADHVLNNPIVAGIGWILTPFGYMAQNYPLFVMSLVLAFCVIRIAKCFCLKKPVDRNPY